MMKKLPSAAIAGLLMLWVLALTPVLAAVPNTLNYRGQLANTAGAPITAAVNMSFSLYTAPMGGAPLWTEGQNVTVTNGFYSVTLGQTVPLSPTFFSVPLYLGITVGGDAEMTPRIASSSVPYALQSSGCSTGFTNCGGGA